ncbi:glycosyltransferase family 2 protein [Rhizobium leguminosarum]|jgi:glycosyltransferase involved in cell wall biosynthesis|uniref:Glycosyltransferase n=1 Tax=Rhizobium leguminosarum bv. viciae TaxID=387 RepID=A0A7G6RHZ3_RHILV|nr:glycosyltransferase [Rhizobium leguminosarum]MBB4522297.1 glycosyltransferase involved in cell wall biosynthesis [Rhizobium leguminosarum]MDH6659988.1 glycosyltransferase involved in cell wall biosynthesis [Rhizobium sophorae]QND41875.1 glycosyltransferase [Rhizobium leguminosarum bv. viciae]TCA35702.1 glycosyltransferase [Rhizobium leguminosarum bv. viciae]
MSADILQPAKAGPAISVIIPTYNRSSFIGEAIDSVLRQTFGDFELIVIDDGSTDGTGEIVRGFEDNRLLFIQQKNAGRSAARNRAIEIARGRYIAFLDSDDTYLQDKLERQVEFMEKHPEIGMIYTSAKCIDAEGNILKNHVYIASVSGQIYHQVAFFRPVTITLPTVMLRREVLDTVGGFDEEMERFEDTDLWRRVSKRYEVGALTYSTCLLRTHDDNTLRTQNPVKIANAIEYYVEKIFREDADMDSDFLKEGASRLYEYYGLAFMTVPAWRRQGLTLLRKSVEFSPKRFGAIAVTAGIATMRTLKNALSKQFRRKTA